MKKTFLVLALLSFSLIYSCNTQKEWQPLFNGQDLKNWDKFIGSSLGSDFDSLAQLAEPDKVFSVTKQDGENLIRISGEVNGSLATTETFENYHLRMVFKWGDKVYSRQNSGLLYHSFGEFGKALGTWMPNIEFQMMHQNLGDTYLMANTTAKTEVVEEDGEYIFTPGTEPQQFGEQYKGQLIRKSSDNENPVGQWNTIELFCYGRTAVHVVNGTIVMVNQSTGTHENGNINPLTSGKIQIQSEGAELFIKSIDIKPITEIPADIVP